jgi:glycosyltransferase involved in cell wall biosynthesis
MACGTPVVAAARGALPETCGEAALLVDPEDPDAFAEAAVTAVSDSTRRAGLVHAGLTRAGELSWDAAARATDAVIDRLVQRSDG